jgi:hypothetical protein
MIQLPKLLFVLVCNDKGGVGKSLCAAMLAEEFAKTGRTINLVEVEQHVEFSQNGYSYAPNVKLTTIPLIAKNEISGRVEPSLSRLDDLWALLPPDLGAGAESIIVVDCGASAFQSLMLWGLDQRGLKPFRDAKYRFVSFVPVQAGDTGAAKFVNTNTSLLTKFGDLILVKNLRAGSDYSSIDPNLLGSLPSMTLIYRGKPLSDFMQQREANFTFRQLAEKNDVPRRPRMEAEDCALHFTDQLNALLKKLGLSTT